MALSLALVWFPSYIFNVFQYLESLCRVRLTNIVKLKHNYALPCATFVKYLYSMLQDEICKSICEKGGIDAILRCLEDSGEQGNKVVAKVCCSLLSKV